MQFEGLNGYFSVGTAEECLYPHTLIVEETVGYAEVAEHHQLQTLQPDLRVAEDYIVLVVADASAFFIQFEGQLVGQAHYYPWPICYMVWRDGTLGVACKEGTVCGFDDEEEVWMVVDVVVEVCLVEGVVSEEQSCVVEGELSVCLEGVFEEELVMVVVLQCISHEQALQSQQHCSLLLLSQQGRGILELPLQIVLPLAVLFQLLGLLLGAGGEGGNGSNLLFYGIFESVDELLLLIVIRDLLVQLFLLLLECCFQ